MRTFCCSRFCAEFGTGLVHAAPNGRDVGLKPSRQEDPVTEANGTTTLRFYANWDSSNHESAFLNKPTVPETRALLRLAFSVNVAGFETTRQFAHIQSDKADLPIVQHSRWISAVLSMIATRSLH